MKVEQAKRMKELENENGRLKRLVAELSLEKQVLKDVASRLDRAGIPYMLSGSMAMHFYAAPRMTRDLDIVIALEAEGIPEFLQAFADSYYIEEEAVRDGIRTLSPFNLIQQSAIVKIDFIPRKKSPYRMLEFSRKLRKKVGDFEICVVTAEDLVLSKLEWSLESGSAVQAGDIRSIVAARPELDLDYIRDWAERLGMEDAWRKFKIH